MPSSGRHRAIGSMLGARHRGRCHTLASMVAILGGLGAALSWAIATLASSRSSRMIGPMSVLGWVMAVGLVAAIVPALLATPGRARPARGRRAGRRRAVAQRRAAARVRRAVDRPGLDRRPDRRHRGRPRGGHLDHARRGARHRDGGPPRRDRRRRRPGRRRALCRRRRGRSRSIPRRPGGRRCSPSPRPSRSRSGSCSRVGSAREGIPPAWVMLVSRTVGVLLIVLPLVLTRRFRLTARRVPLVVLAGILEVFGGAIYIVAASEGVAVAAVLSSQFAAHRRGRRLPALRRAPPAAPARRRRRDRHRNHGPRRPPGVTPRPIEPAQDHGRP